MRVGSLGVLRARTSAGLAALLLVLALASACEIEIRRRGAAPELPSPAAGSPAGEGDVRLIIVEGPLGSTLAFVPVMIEGEGPFRFALDTGASRSVVDQAIAERLGLPQEGEAQPGFGVGGPARAIPVRVEEWSMGEVGLGAGTILSMDLGGPEQQDGFEGLLGSDILSQFGRITIDYEQGVLILDRDGEP